MSKVSGLGPVLALIVLALLTTAMNPSFLDPNNLLNLLRQVSINGLIAFGMTFVILTGGIDLSVGAILALTSALSAMMITSGVPTLIAMLVGIIIGGILGGVNGLIITKGGAAPFIASLATYVISGIMSSAAGMILISRLSSAQPDAGTGFEMDAIAAVVLGGTSLAGGRGRIFGTLIGALIIGTLNNGMNLIGISSFYQQIVKGIVIIIAVLLDRRKKA